MNAFNAERQSFYDNEQHLKSRIQSLVNARKRGSLELLTHVNKDNEEYPSALSEEDTIDENLDTLQTATIQEADTGANEPEELPEMISLRLELSTLSTSYASLQTTVQLLSAQLLDLKRVNNQLQEENESYNILLRERTLNGQFDILKSVGAEQNDDDIDSSDSEGDGGLQKVERSSVRSGPRSILEPVAETWEDQDGDYFVVTRIFIHPQGRESTRQVGGRGAPLTVTTSQAEVPRTYCLKTVRTCCLRYGVGH